ncbi:MAG: MATE family efflux transporter [Lachnospiraceae bacterium]|nr:MATE family efflux transporter [Lachnospiraceae bacterium]
MSIKDKFVSREIDFTTGPILRRILVFGLPILIGSIFQQLYNIVDSIVVGNYVGTEALAAVGNASTISFCLVGITIGLTGGSSVAVAQLVGAKQNDYIKKAISTAFIFCVIVAAVLMLIGIGLARPIMGWVRVPEELMHDSVLYMSIYVGGSLFLMTYNFFSSVLRALGDSFTPLIFLIIATVLNIIGDLFFVVVCGLGVAGVAIATVIAQAISAILCAIYCYRKMDYFRFKKGEFVFYRPLFKDIVRLSVPSAIQFATGSLGFVFVQGLINSFGTAYIAAYTTTSRLEGFAHLPMECFTQALAVFVGQNIGARNIPRIKTALLRVIIALCSICLVIALLVYTIGPEMISIFVGEGGDEVIAIGSQFLRIWAPFTLIFALMNCFNSVLRGAGDSLFVMLSSFLDIGVRTLSAYFLILVVGMDYYGIAYAMMIGWSASMIEVGIRYFTGKWKTKAISAVGGGQAASD